LFSAFQLLAHPFGAQKYNHFLGDKALIASEGHRHFAISRKFSGD
jgi:hypothetical protein